ncbi:MAG: putative glycoside hydrolase [Acidimicrobiia bacterium]
MLALLAGAGTYLGLTGGGELGVFGIVDGAVLGAGEAEPTLEISTGRSLDDLAVTLDGRPLTVTPGDAGEASVTLTDLSDGHHTVDVVVSRPFPHGPLESSVGFSVDTTPPTIRLLGPLEPVPVGSEVTIQVEVDDPGATVTIDGEQIEPGPTGVVDRTYPEPPDGEILVSARDSMGNLSELSVSVELALPGMPGGPPMIGVHATGYTWATAELRDPIIEMIGVGLINTVQLDLKDEAGDIWYDTDVQLAHDIGAVTVLWDLEEVVDELHARGVRVVARIVNFRDPRLADHAIETGNMDWVIQNPDGTAYGQYGGFANPFDPTVREYNIALAEEAARLGVDDVLFDYVRRPDTLSELVYPGQYGAPEDAIVDFLAETLPRVRDAGARLGASVFGIAATRPEEVAQDIPRMAEHLDYVAPMTYPSHWGPGEYGVADPHSQPYDITYRSLLDFVELTEGTGAHVVAWLQDFSLGVTYGPAEVRAQIEAARDAGVDHFLLWDAATTYTRAALDPIGG